MRSNAAYRGQGSERHVLGVGIAMRRGERQSEDGGIVLRRETAIRHFNDASDHALAVGLDAADDGVVVLLDQVLLADVVSATLGTEDQETIKSRPVVHCPTVATGVVGNLRRAGDGLELRSDPLADAE